MLHASSMSYEYFTLDGTYDINEEENQITLTFPANALSGMDMASCSGTFSFSMEEDYLMIGGVRYEKESAPSDTEAQAEEETLLEKFGKQDTNLD